jgi:hypothetical protein
VGKSSLCNALLGVERNIVTDIPGTTRDSINTHYNYYGKDFWTNYGVFTVNKSPIVIRTLYGFDMFMKNINIDKNKKLESPLKWKTSENIVPKSLENLFKNYLKKEELEEVEI